LIHRKDGLQIPKEYDDLIELLSIHLDMERHDTASLLTPETLSEMRDDSTRIFARIFNLPVTGTQLEVELRVGSVQIKMKKTLATLLLLLDVYGHVKTADDLWRDLNTAAEDVAQLVEKITSDRVIQIQGRWIGNRDLVNGLVRRDQAHGTAGVEAAGGSIDVKDGAEKQADDSTDRAA
jgi:hypothetical protein